MLVLSVVGETAGRAIAAAVAAASAVVDAARVAIFAVGRMQSRRLTDANVVIVVVAGRQ